MTNKNRSQFKYILLYTCIYFALIGGFPNTIFAYDIIQEISNHKEFKGIVVDKTTNKPLVSATVTLKGSNISTVTNDEGKFLLKVPNNFSNGKITVYFLGYNDKTIELSSFKNDFLKISLNTSVTQLSEVNIDPKNPNAIMKAVMKNRAQNYHNDPTIMTAFYRETIQKRKKYVSLSEAVLDVYKKSYLSSKNDIIKLYKARKSADYKRLDTLTIKLQGGPSSTLFIDVMKKPENLFTDDMLRTYEFSFDTSTKINNRYIYVLNFKQRPEITDLYYYGKVFIDSQTLAMTKAVFSLNLSDKAKASKLFVRKKPNNAKVYPTEATYNIDYREKDGKWYYGYGRIDLTFKINWKKRLFNSIYKLNVEMAVTDWKKNNTNESIRSKEQLKSSVVISDEASGFSDPTFWGEYNVIEPEKSIESAIQKIKKQLRKLN